MKWIKKGLIYAPDKAQWWSQYYGILPTPEFLEDQNRLRVYFAATDKERRGRVSYLDLDPKDPSKILYQHKEPILDIGKPGTFDERGLNPSSIVSVKNKKFLYYVGYQKRTDTPYALWSGLAVSDDGSTFVRCPDQPIIPKDSYVSHGAPYVIFEDNTFRMWLWASRKWVSVKGKPYLQADIRYAESPDGLSWNVSETPCIEPDTPTEFSVGRPWVIKENNSYKMWYSIRYIDKLYRIGYAESQDGMRWQRKDRDAGIDVSETGWDSEMICYPAVISVADKTYMFYNGNNNGETGFGYAVLEK